MSKLTFGEVDWNSGDVQVGASDFLKLEEGETTVRVMGNPIQFYVNWVQPTGGGKNRKIISPVSNEKLMNALDDAGYKRQARWMVVVLDRQDDDLKKQKFKLLEIGSQIYSGIKTLYNKKAWGPVTKYDIVITRGAPGSQPLYSVVPNPKTSVEAIFKKPFAEFMKRIDIDKFMQPATTAEVCEILGWNTADFLDGEEQEDAFGDEAEETPEIEETVEDAEEAEAEEAEEAEELDDGEYEFDFDQE